MPIYDETTGEYRFTDAERRQRTERRRWETATGDEVDELFEIVAAQAKRIEDLERTVRYLSGLTP